MRNINKLLLEIVLIIFCVCPILGYGQQAPEAIMVGAPLPLTGMYAGFGEGALFGIKAAVDDINKLGGVYVKEYGKRIPIKLIVVNNESDPMKGGSLAEDLIVRSRVHFLVSGDQPPPMHAGVATVSDRYKVPYVTCSGPLEPWSEMRTKGKWEYSWATGLFAIATPAPQGDFRAKPGYTIVDTWAEMLKLYGDKTNKKVAVFAADDPDGVGWYALFPQFLKQLGYEVCGIDKKVGLLPLETTDFSSVIRTWKSFGAEILWGNAPAPFVGTLLRQAKTLGFKPKIISIGRAPLFYEDIAAWGGDLPLGVGCEIWWDPSFEESPGIGGTTPRSLAERWEKEKNKPLNRGIGPGYRSMQVLIDAIQRAGTLKGEEVNKALAQTDLMTIAHRVKFDENHFSRGPIVYGQWRKTKSKWGWECPVVFSKHSFIKATASPIFPIP